MALGPAVGSGPRQPLSVARVGVLLALLPLPLLMALQQAGVPAEALSLSPADYLPLHTLMESAAVLAAMLVFWIVWHADSARRSAGLLGLAACLLGAALLDVAHALSFSGMPTFVTAAGREKAAAFWLASRLLVALGLLAAAWAPPAVTPGRAARLALLGAVLAACALVAWQVLWQPERLHHLDDGQRLLPAKLAAEAVLMGLFGLAAWRLQRRVPAAEGSGRACLFIAAALGVPTEAAMSMYGASHDAYNLLGHVYKLGAYYLLYRGVLQQTLRLSLRQLGEIADALQAAASPVLVADGGGRIRWVNAALCRATGYADAELLGRPVSVFEAGAGAGADYRPLQLAMRAGLPWSGRLPVLRRDGSSYLDQRTVTPIRNDLGELTGHVWVGEDVTERIRAVELLRNSEESLRRLVDCAPDAIIVTDAVGVIQQANPQVLPLLGYRPEELEGVALERLMAPEMAAHHGGFMAGFAHGRRGMTGEGREVQALRKDGSLVVVHIRVGEMPYRGGRSFVGFMRDMTQQYRERAALAEREQQFREVLAASADGVWLTDLQGRLLEVNDAYVRRSGYSRDELLRLNIGDLSVRETAAERAAHIAHIVRQGRETFETVHRAKGGELWQAEVSVTYSTKAGPRLFVFVRDISERKRAEAALRHSEEKLRKMYDLSPLGIALTDMAGRFLDFNQSFVALTGYAPQELLRLSYWDLTPTEYAPGESHNLEALQRSGRYGPYEKEYRRKDGSRLPVRLNGVRITLDGLPCIWSIAEDLTAQRRAAAEHERLQRQLMQAQKMEALGQLTGGIAHDFNNMLTGILGLSTLARERHVDDPNSKLGIYLGEIAKVAERGRDLIGKLMRFSRPESAQPATVRPVRPVVEEVLQMLRSAMPSRVEVTLQAEDGLPSVRIAEVDLHQILTNLLINARDAIAGEGRVQIELARVTADHRDCTSCGLPIEGEQLVLRVRDSGSGIPPEALPRIFDPFFTTKDVGKGTGLGLAMVHSMVHQVGGHIVVRSGADGTTVELLLPAAAAEAPPAARGRGPVAAPAPTPGRDRVWVVDDDPVVRVYVDELLSARGWRVTSFGDPLQALQALRAEPKALDWLITDQMMPGLSGTELARAALALRPELPVILCTGYSDRVDEAAARALGVRHYVRKPFEPQQLLDALTQADPAPA